MTAASACALSRSPNEATCRSANAQPDHARLSPVTVQPVEPAVVDRWHHGVETASEQSRAKLRCDNQSTAFARVEIAVERVVNDRRRERGYADVLLVYLADIHARIHGRVQQVRRSERVDRDLDAQLQSWRISEQDLLQQKPPVPDHRIVAQDAVLALDEVADVFPTSAKKISGPRHEPPSPVPDR